MDMKPVLILGNGPSFDQLELGRLKIPTMGVNKSLRIWPSTYHAFLSNGGYWKTVLERGRNVRALFPYDPREHRIYRNLFGLDLMTTPLTGLFAIGCAMLLGHNDIRLVGFDCAPKQGHAQRLFREDEEDKVMNRQSVGMSIIEAAHRLKKKRPDVRITNLGGKWSMLDCWPRGEVESCYQP